MLGYRLMLIIILLFPIKIEAQNILSKYKFVLDDSNCYQKTYHATTDSSSVFLCAKEYELSFQETIKSKGLKYKIIFYPDSTIREKSTLDSMGSTIGDEDYYTKTGQWIKSINYADKTWKQNPATYPYYNLVKKMKYTADSIIISTYSQTFLDKYLVFDFFQSCLYSTELFIRAPGDTLAAGYLGDWTTPVDVKPAEFLLRYNIKYDSSHIYRDKIEMTLDSNGKIKINSEGLSPTPKGFEKLSGRKNTFKLTYDKALSISKKHGLSDTATHLSYFLRWDYNEHIDSTTIYNGNFRFYIVEYNRTEKKGVNKEYSEVIDYYTAWVYNPWNKKLVTKKKMKNFHRLEGSHGSSTGLIDDK
ncbi:MAG: hypothetical protein JST82_06510 [Bacteroidetes bacterium]|nr:hypothetical protein [Bacteroidota bacterium]